MAETTPTRRVLSVSELTFRIKSSLEKQFTFVWIKGEVSNFRRPMSGHYYFSLKDDNAQINAVMFKGQNKNLKFDIEDGMAITGLGRISVYEPRGTYQIILEYVEPHGTGELQIAFEQLKKRLSAEGLFDDDHKKALPFLPQKISLITSPTGAVVHDMQQTIHRRFPNIAIQIVPVKVQGDGAIEEIVAALSTVNERRESDVIIVARGGGSIEDLQAFNSEPVAKAIYASEIPVISAVGHETDFTIADFVADVRAATPSVAAELATPLKNELSKRCLDFSQFLLRRFQSYLAYQRDILSDLTRRVVDPRRKIVDMRIHIDDLSEMQVKNMRLLLRSNHERRSWLTEKLRLNSPLNRVDILKSKLNLMDSNLKNLIGNEISKQRSIIDVLNTRLHDLNPRAVLARGYSITRSTDGTIVRSSDEVDVGQELEVILDRGNLGVTVENKKISGK